MDVYKVWGDHGFWAPALPGSLLRDDETIKTEVEGAMDDNGLRKIRAEVQYWGNSPQAALMESIKEYCVKGSHRPQSLTLRIQKGAGNPSVPGGMGEELSYWSPGLVGSLLAAIEDYIRANRSTPGLLVLVVKPGNRWQPLSVSTEEKEKVEEDAEEEIRGGPECYRFR